tara:strand:- start:13019 stop:13852 length:834 start_codon:yes stop_codon:yes gene_type:complete
VTYDAQEIGIQTGEPVEVYEFVYGSTSRFYTSSEAIESIGAQDYTPVAISRSNTKDGPAERTHDFQVVLPTTDTVSQLFVGQIPGVRVRLTVKRFHRTDTPTPEVRTIFNGFVQSGSFKRKARECTLTARPILGGSGRTHPRRTFQAACNHVLYDPLTCRADDTDPANRASVVTVVSQVGNVMTLSGIAGLFTDGWFNGGYVEFVGQADFRMVLDHVGNVLTLMQPFATTPSTVNVLAGCDHSIDGPQGCKLKHNNVINFGGFPFVPTKNPFQSGLV